MRIYRLAFALSLYLLSSLFPAHAHPIPKNNYDRSLTVRLTADAVVVEYHLELDGGTAAEDLRHVVGSEELAELTTRQKVYAAFTRLYGPILAGNVTATLDKQELEFQCIKDGHQEKDSLHCDFIFRAAWKPALGTRHAFALQERNYLTNVGRIKVSLANDTSVKLLERDEASAALKERPPLEWRSDDEKRLRQVGAVFEVGTVAPQPAEKSAPSITAPAPEARPKTLLDLLLSSDLGIGTLLLLAAGFGAVHALTPGHGKTMVAAYLVGERGTVWHAVLLGIVTTLTHTGIVWIVALSLAIYYPDTVPAHVETGLAFIGGLLVAGLGFWLLLRRLGGGPDHFHIGGHGHHHHHHGDADHYHDEHGHAHALSPPGWWGLIVLGFSGGIVPCWDAIFMVVYAIAAHIVWLALPLLLAFSAGLAGVLVVIGVLVVKARGFAGSRWGESRLFRALPIISAAMVTLLGLWLCYDSIHPHETPPPDAVSRG